MTFNAGTNYVQFSEVGTDYRLFPLVENVTRSLKVPIRFINITGLSEYRKDAHTSVYTIKQGKLLTKEQQSDPDTYADCIHWCLPGLPDTWNEFLYTYIISKSKSPWPLKKVIVWNSLIPFLEFFFSNFLWICEVHRMKFQEKGLKIFPHGFYSTCEFCEGSLKGFDQENIKNILLQSQLCYKIENLKTFFSHVPRVMTFVK